MSEYDEHKEAPPPKDKSKEVAPPADDGWSGDISSQYTQAESTADQRPDETTRPSDITDVTRDGGPATGVDDGWRDTQSDAAAPNGRSRDAGGTPAALSDDRSLSTDTADPRGKQRSSVEATSDDGWDADVTPSDVHPLGGLDHRVDADAVAGRQADAPIDDGWEPESTHAEMHHAASPEATREPLHDEAARSAETRDQGPDFAYAAPETSSSATDFRQGWGDTADGHESADANPPHDRGPDGESAARTTDFRTPEERPTDDGWGDAPSPMWADRGNLATERATEAHDDLDALERKSHDGSSTADAHRAQDVDLASGDQVAAPVEAAENADEFLPAGDRESADQPTYHETRAPDAAARHAEHIDQQPGADKSSDGQDDATGTASQEHPRAQAEVQHTHEEIEHGDAELSQGLSDKQFAIKQQSGEPRLEPQHLKRGKEHDREQKESWRNDALDIEFDDRPGLKKYTTGSQGFTDIRGRAGEGSDGLVVEVKSDDLDRLTEAALHRRIEKYVDQIENYMYSPSLEFETIQGAVQFQRRPLMRGRAEAVEDLFNEHGITCVWLDD